MLEILWLILGLVGLWLGTELIILASLGFSKQFKFSHLFIGLTILAIGTDLPELIVNITASISTLKGMDSSGLIIGNIIGSSMGQLALTMGIAGLLGTLFLTKRQLKRDGLMLLLSVVALFLVVFSGTVTRLEGILLILIYVFYFMTLQREEKTKEKEARAQKVNVPWAIGSLLGGFVILFISSNAVVDNSLLLVSSLNLSQTLVGSLIIGLGTSIPELALVVGTIRKNVAQLGVGNLIGSNIFDVLFVTGLSATIAPLVIEKSVSFFDIPFLFITSVIAIILFWNDQRLYKREAAILVGLYILYVILKIFGY
jgi:cation:H+ antiporter